MIIYIVATQLLRDQFIFDRQNDRQNDIYSFWMRLRHRLSSFHDCTELKLVLNLLTRRGWIIYESAHLRVETGSLTSEANVLPLISHLLLGPLLWKDLFHLICAILPLTQWVNYHFTLNVRGSYLLGMAQVLYVSLLIESAYCSLLFSLCA